MIAVLEDPPVREDGLCAVCLKPRRFDAKKLHHKEAMLDPFCASACARAWHGTALTRRSVHKAAA